MKRKVNRLKIILAEKDMENNDLCDMLGVNKVTVSRWVNNHRQPSYPMLFNIARALDVSVCNLIVSKEDYFGEEGDSSEVMPLAA